MIAARQQTPADAPAAERIDAPTEAIRSWLAALTALLRLPEREAADIRDELEAHLRERARDLMVGGMDEGAAVRAAVSELGEAAEVAARFREARVKARRRTLMNGSILGMAAAALTLSVVSLVQPGSGGTRATVFQPSPPAAVTELSAVKVKGDFRDTPLTQVLAFISQSAGKSIVVEWKVLENVGAQPDNPVTLTAPSTSLQDLMDRLSSELRLDGPNRLDFRLVDGTIRVATQQYFDRAERKLVSYDLSGVFAKGIEGADLFKVMTSLVEPEGWSENGGDLARAYGIGERMFVEAPARYHERIAWILNEVAPKEGHANAAQEAGVTTRQIALQFANAEGMREMLALWISTSPAMSGVGGVERGAGGGSGGMRVSSNANTNEVVLHGPPDKVKLLGRLVAVVDRPAGSLPDAVELRREFRLKHVTPTAARELLGRIFNVSPALKQCAVPRGMECDDNQMSFVLTATADQVTQVEQLIGWMDSGTVQVAMEPSPGEAGVRVPATSRLSFRADGDSVLAMDADGAFQLRAREFHISLPEGKTDRPGSEPPPASLLLGYSRGVPVLSDLPLLNRQFLVDYTIDLPLRH